MWITGTTWTRYDTDSDFMVVCDRNMGIWGWLQGLWLEQGQAPEAEGWRWLSAGRRNGLLSNCGGGAENVSSNWNNSWWPVAVSVPACQVGFIRRHTLGCVVTSRKSSGQQVISSGRLLCCGLQLSTVFRASGCAADTNVFLAMYGDIFILTGTPSRMGCWRISLSTNRCSAAVHAGLTMSTPSITAQPCRCYPRHSAADAGGFPDPHIVSSGAPAPKRTCSASRREDGRPSLRVQG